MKVEIYLKNETIWLTQQKIADLFGVDRSVITKHLKNIFESNELNKDSVCAIFAHSAADGKKYETTFYNLDSIISVGCRVNNSQATAFRIWATEGLKEYIIKGFMMDDERLKNPNYVFRMERGYTYISFCNYLIGKFYKTFHNSLTQIFLLF